MNTSSVINRVTFNLILAVVCVIILFPVFWTITGAFKSTDQFYREEPVWFTTPTLEHFASAIEMAQMGPAFVNSLFVSVGTVCASLFFGSMAAYSLSRFRFPGSSIIPFIFLFFRMIPHIVLLFPVFLILNTYRLLDTHFGLMLVYCSFTLPFTTWVMIGFFRDLPKDLEDAATMDGCGIFKTYLVIFVPLITPAFAAVGILVYTFSWNEFLYSSILTRKNALTLPSAMSRLIVEHRVHWPELCSMASVIIVPVILLAIFMQRYLVQGLTRGAVR